MPNAVALPWDSVIGLLAAPTNGVAGPTRSPVTPITPRPPPVGAAPGAPAIITGVAVPVRLSIAKTCVEPSACDTSLIVLPGLAFSHANLFCSNARRLAAVFAVEDSPGVNCTAKPSPPTFMPKVGLCGFESTKNFFCPSVTSLGIGAILAANSVCPSEERCIKSAIPFGPFAIAA